MMAYTRKLVTSCWEHHCQAHATDEVIGQRNESYGKFCQKHAATKVRELQREEQARREAGQG